MPCPSQMIEDEEEGDQVNSARQTGCSRQHYWNYFPLWPMEIKANGCDVSAGDSRKRGLSLTCFSVQLDRRTQRLKVAYV